MILELDAGNTRIKWRLLEEGKKAPRAVAQGSVDAQEKEPHVFIDLGLQFDGLPFDRIRRMKVANVRGAKFRDALSALMTERWRLRPEYAVSERECAGVRNSYEDPAALGVDRWLAMLAAWRRASGPCCIVDAGTAIKVDLLDGDGRHLGGYIVPGLGAMREALAQRAPRLRLEGEPPWRLCAPGRSTRQAIEHGILSTAVGLLERVAREYASAGVQWFLCGGDADVLARQLSWGHELSPDLVLEGLALALE